MKKLTIILIDFYQAVLGTILKNLLGVGRFCRFEETCSAYSKRMVKEQGVIKGIALSLLRLSKCQPFYKLNYGNI